MNSGLIILKAKYQQNPNLCYIVIRLRKDKLDEEITTEFAGLRPKTYFYLINHDNSDKKASRTQKICNKTNTQV